KKIAKYLERIKKRFYFALAFENYGSRECFKKSSAKYFQKKTLAKVWWLKIFALPLHHFPPRKRGRIVKEKVLNIQNIVL
ncbi:hypothetical protein D1647_19495, partial [Alistipes sp. Z76]|nr:hypothetical protein [Alistipes sp. Z76]